MSDKKVIEIPTLINEEYFKTYSPYPDNYNLKDIKPYFHIAEKIWIEPILGTALYEQLLEQVNTNTVTEENSTLLLMLYPFLAFAITYESSIFVAYKFTEVGLVVGHSDNSTAAPVSGLNIVQNRLRSTVETLKTNFKKWLDSHSDNFPLYTPDSCLCSNDQCDDCQWVLDYFGGNPNAYRNSSWFMNKNKPNTRLQAFSTPRKRIDLM